MKKTLKKFIPPVFLELFGKKPKYGFLGDFRTWAEVQANATGYDSPIILEKVKNSLLKVKAGEAAYERDSVAFEKIEYSWFVLAGLLWIASENDNGLVVLDFGGSLGSSYFQYKSFFTHLKEFKWNIVEQQNFAECGKKFFTDEHLSFFNSLEACLKQNKVDAFLALSSLQYLEDPYGFMEQVVALDFKYIIIDRTPFFPNNDKITVQRVNPKIYDASYPAWIMNENKFLKIVEPRYALIGDSRAFAGDTPLRGFIFKRL